MELSYLVLDSELKKLLNSFAKRHPSGSKEVLKTVLKMYMKFLDRYKGRKGDPLIYFKDLIEKIILGKALETTPDKIAHLDALLEAEDGLPSSIQQDIKDIKRQLMGGGGVVPKAAEKKTVKTNLKSFTPKEGAQIKIIDKNPIEKKRKNYRELRKKKRPKKINF